MFIMTLLLVFQCVSTLHKQNDEETLRSQREFRSIEMGRVKVFKMFVLCH